MVLCRSIHAMHAVIPPYLLLRMNQEQNLLQAPQSSALHSVAAMIVGKPKPVPGYIYGLKQPSIKFKVALGQGVPMDRLALADRMMRERCAGIELDTDGTHEDAHIRFLCDWTRLILEKNGHPVLEKAKIYKSLKESQLSWVILQPCLDFLACLAAVGLCFKFMTWLLKSPVDEQALGRSLDKELERIATALRRGRLSGFNTLHFLKAAHELGIPWQRLSENIFQVGIGASSRLLESSFTDRTPSLSTVLARNKVRAAKLMRDAGLPAPPHFLATTAKQALAAAERLGYPVVVKPADKDGGVGVSAYLNDASAVGKAFERAVRHSRHILVEKHVHGKDYRLQIVNGVVHGVLERSPGGIVGNGHDTVAKLVERQNQERKTATDDRRFLHSIVLDDEAEIMLAAVGMDLNSVPEPGRFVRLRGASNVASGGIPVPVPVDEVHPDNIALAVRAVRILRLDVAGVDLLIPDIRKSWNLSGAGICEVNAQPQMFTTLHTPMLRSLMDGTDGRVPVVIVLSPAPGEQVSSMLHERLCITYPASGLVSSASVRIGMQQIFEASPGTFIASRALMVDSALQSLVIAVSDKQVLTHGWPVDRCDAVILAGGDPSSEPSLETDFRQLCSLVKALKPRAVFVDESDPVCRSEAQKSGWPDYKLLDSKRSGQANSKIVETVVEWLIHSR